MTKQYLVSWSESTRVIWEQQLQQMTDDLKEYSKSPKANIIALKKREETIRALAQIYKSTVQTMNAIAECFEQEHQEQFRRGMKFQEKLSKPQLDKYGSGKEAARFDSIFYSIFRDNL